MMKISDSLRPECMPEMAYTITKMASLGKYKPEEIMDLITLGVKSDEYKKAFEFCKECQFINVDKEDIVHSNINSKDLNTFKDFRYSTCLEVMKNDNQSDFKELVEWVLTSYSEVIAANSADKLSTIKSVPKQQSNREYFLGFRFWFVALGFGIINTKGIYTSLIPTPHAIIDQWISNNSSLWSTEKVLFRDFLIKLTSDLPIFLNCVTGNEINDSLSIALRILHYSGKIRLEYTVDMPDTWYLSKTKDTAVYRFTEIKVR